MKKKEEIGDVEKHLKEGRTPRFSYIFPIIKDNKVLGVIVSKFSLDKEFHSIEHFQKALIKYLVLSIIVFFPVFFILLNISIISPIKKLVKASLKLSQGNFKIDLNTVDRNDEIGTFSKTFLKMAKNLRSNYERYLSFQVVELLSQKSGFIENVKIQKVATIMFCDLANFTQFSQNISAEILTSFLNSYFENMTEIIFKYNGTLDKYIGDGIIIRKKIIIFQKIL